MSPDTENTIHASCVAIDGKGVLLGGCSGSGKSDLTLRLLDRGAALISDDYTLLYNRDGNLIASAPPSIAGKIEVRGLGIIDWPNSAQAEIALYVALDESVERMPEPNESNRVIFGKTVPAIALHALEASAPLKVELALRGLKGPDPSHGD